MTNNQPEYSQASINPKLTLGVFTRRLQKNELIKKSFNAQEVLLKPRHKNASKIDLVIGWGRKPQALKAANYARKNKLPYLTVEDGFIHSMGQGRLGTPSWSLVVDSLGVFYDANTASSLENWINKSQLTPKQELRASQAITNIKAHNVTKYNNAKLTISEAIKNLEDSVLVIDQVLGDMSIPNSLATKESFDIMLETALSENPNSNVLIKVHPDVINGKRKGCITLPKQLPERVYLISENLNSLSLLQHVQKVYVVSSQTGFEALMMDKQVICFGAPFYAGWGLTDDRLDKSRDVFRRRGNKAHLTTVFYAAYIEYSKYFHPDTMQECELEEIINYIEFQYSKWKECSGKIFCIGFSPWKRRFIKSYLKTPDNEVIFTTSYEEAKTQGFDNNSKACLWSSRFENEAKKLSNEFSTPIWRIEDGFIRSVSLGSNYAPPASLVIDKQGLYFNPQTTSDLEDILLHTTFTKDQLEKASLLKRQLISQAISKYNVGERGVKNLFPNGYNRKKILIPGQVADDASILKGCRDINSNIDLIKTVRNDNPDAFLIFKPHPDVVSGNRKGELDSIELNKYCDQVVIDISIPDCLQQVDEVHTMTSLVGFEGLMRGLKVFCYGIPFYSGWGLTTDRYQCNRRTKELSINQLVAGTLICYPRYMNWSNECFTTATHTSNTIYKQLNESKALGKSHSALPPTYLGKLRKKLNLLTSILNPTLK